MARIFATLVALGFASTSFSGATAQQQTPFARLAAVRFALENGWQIPRTNIVVVSETTLGLVDARPVRQTREQQLLETQEIVSLLGPGVKAGRANDYLSCPVAWVCRASTDTYVLVVYGLLQGENDVLIRLYTPASRNGGSATLTNAIVDLERRGATDWAAVRYRLQPQVIVRRR